jgi:hypothetical protein
MTQEPSVLDYIKAKLTPWRGPAPKIPTVEEIEEPSPPREMNQVAEQRVMPASARAISKEPATKGPYNPVLIAHGC